MKKTDNLPTDEWLDNIEARIEKVERILDKRTRARAHFVEVLERDIH